MHSFVMRMSVRRHPSHTSQVWHKGKHISLSWKIVCDFQKLSYTKSTLHSTWCTCNCISSKTYWCRYFWRWRRTSEVFNQYVASQRSSRIEVIWDINLALWFFQLQRGELIEAGSVAANIKTPSNWQDLYTVDLLPHKGKRGPLSAVEPCTLEEKPIHILYSSCPKLPWMTTLMLWGALRCRHWIGAPFFGQMI